MKSRGSIVAGLIIALFGISQLQSVSAVSTDISRAYSSNTSIPNGSLVSLDATNKNYVVTSNTNNSNLLLGVAVTKNNSLLEVNSSNSTIQVAVSGIVDTLVSNVNGNIKTGDQIGASPFNGIGMLAAASSHVVGMAQSPFDVNGVNVQHQQVKDVNGKVNTITIGYIPVKIANGTSSSVSSGGGNKLNFLQSVVKSLNGHVISTARIVLSIIVALVATGILLTLIYAAIFGSLVSIGRNPLAKHEVFRTLAYVVGMAVITALVAGITIYFLLK